jgi:hypothetical protein
MNADIIINSFFDDLMNVKRNIKKGSCKLRLVLMCSFKIIVFSLFSLSENL